MHKENKCVTQALKTTRKVQFYLLAIEPTDQLKHFQQMPEEHTMYQQESSCLMVSTTPYLFQKNKLLVSRCLKTEHRALQPPIHFHQKFLIVPINGVWLDNIIRSTHDREQ